MSLFYLHPEDRRWLKRWFRNNLVCLGIIVAFLMMLSFASSVPQMINVSAVQSESNAITPEGWRRTNRGWEHTSRWMLPTESQHRFPIADASLEPAWTSLNSNPVPRAVPLAIALAQIGLIVTIFRASRTRRARN
ncbi:MAG: hypothetical protein AAGG48_25145 [Planctomycetota bacterium]